MERYGGSTTEIVELEAREDESEVISMGLAEQLRVTEAIQARESSSLPHAILS